jgi:hypothetical protein
LIIKVIAMLLFTRFQIFAAKVKIRIGNSNADLEPFGMISERLFCCRLMAGNSF